MKVVYMAREYPPEVYGGAGVHLEHLARAMSRLAEVEVRCFGDRTASPGNPRVLGFPPDRVIFGGNDDPARGALEALLTCLRFNARPLQADVAHCHTWYSHLGGLLARLAYGIPLVVTVHSLEPRRPWKRQQLGRGYDVSTWVESQALEAADAVIAVSEQDRTEILRLFRVAPERMHVVPNGVDTKVYRPADGRETLVRHGLDPDRPFVLFVGRLSRQKGIGHFLRAAALLPPDVGVVLVAASPDAPDIEEEVSREVAALRARRSGVVWLRAMLPRSEAIDLYSRAAVFCCPSVYEPFGIINLEAMACETPVVATAVGGMLETVIPGETGLLVPFQARSEDDPEPVEPERLARDLAGALSRLLADPPLRAEMGRQGRRRVIEHYSWDRVAARTMEIYRSVASGAAAREHAGPLAGTGRAAGKEE